MQDTSETSKKPCPAQAEETLSTLFHPCDKELLLRITTCLAQNGYFKEVGVMVEVDKAFWNDEQIWDAIKDVPGRDGHTHLMFAAKKGDLARVSFLLARGAICTAATTSGDTALHMSILPKSRRH